MSVNTIPTKNVSRSFRFGFSITLLQRRQFYKIVFHSFPDDQPQLLSITDLCDHVLIKIFSHLNLYDRCLIVPQVCRRFASLLSLCLPKQIDSEELQGMTWNKMKISTLFRKIGPTLTSITISHINDKDHLNVMLMEIRKNCVDIANLHIEQSVNMNHVVKLPKTIRKIKLDSFRGSSLNLRHLNNLDTLHLGVVNIPCALDWIKVEKRLKEIQLTLNIEEIPKNISTIDKLMSSISDDHSVYVDIYDETGYNRFISLEPFKNVSNIKGFSIVGYNVGNEDINKMLQIFAEKNTLVKMAFGCITCNADESPAITLKTIDSLLRCTSLEMIEFNYNYYINSMISGFMGRLNFKYFLMSYGYAGEAEYFVELSIETFENIVQFIEMYIAPSSADEYPDYLLSYCPLDRSLTLLFQIKDEDIWTLFSSVYLQDAPQLIWTARKSFDSFDVQIEARALILMNEIKHKNVGTK